MASANNISDNNILEWPSGRLDFSQGTLVMGILNITPDSFSDGGMFLHKDHAVEQGLLMAEQGAAVIDIGAESSRPGSKPVSAAEQIKRSVPVIKSLVRKIKIPISIDTADVSVAQAALDAGASIINDITALADEKMADLAAQTQVPVVLMHMQGRPVNMQTAPVYNSVVDEVLDFLLNRADTACKRGIHTERIIIDPGIGFGKTHQHNICLLHNIDKFVNSNYRCLVGTSRKSMIGEITGKHKPADRLFGTAAAVAHCAAKRVSMVRVHDVGEMIDVIKVIQAVA